MLAASPLKTFLNCYVFTFKFAVLLQFVDCINYESVHA